MELLGGFWEKLGPSELAEEEPAVRRGSGTMTMARWAEAAWQLLLAPEDRDAAAGQRGLSQGLRPIGITPSTSQPLFLGLGGV